MTRLGREAAADQPDDCAGQADDLHVPTVLREPRQQGAEEDAAEVHETRLQADIRIKGGGSVLRVSKGRQA